VAGKGGWPVGWGAYLDALFFLHIRKCRPYKYVLFYVTVAVQMTKFSWHRRPNC